MKPVCHGVLKVSDDDTISAMCSTSTSVRDWACGSLTAVIAGVLSITEVGGSGLGDLPRLIEVRICRRCRSDRCFLVVSSSEEASALSVAAPECLSIKRRETVVMSDMIGQVLDRIVVIKV